METIEKILKKKVKPYRPSRPAFSAVVTGILALSHEKTKREKISVHAVYYAFGKLAGKYAEYFRRVRFSEIGGEVHSGRLEDTLFRLSAFGLYSVENPKLEYCKIPENSRQRLLSDLKELYGKEFSERLEEMTTDFIRYVDEYRSRRRR